MDPVTLEENTSYTLPACAFTAPEGKEFAGWTVNGTNYNAGDSITISADTSVVASWKDIEAPVTPDEPDDKDDKDNGKKAGCFGAGLATTGISMVLIAFLSLGALFIKRKAE